MSEERNVHNEFDQWFDSSTPPQEIKEELRRQNSAARAIVKKECDNADLVSVVVGTDTVLGLMDRGMMMEIKEISVPVSDGKQMKVLIINTLSPFVDGDSKA